MSSEAVPVLIALCILYYLTSYTPPKEDYKNITELADSMLKTLQDAAEDNEDENDKIKKKNLKIKETVKTGFEPIRIKSSPDVRASVVYKKDGTEQEATANGTGWATCADSTRSKDIYANKQKAIELCEEWHKSNTPNMVFGNNSGEFVCKVVNDSLDVKGEESRAKACPYMRIVSKDIAN